MGIRGFRSFVAGVLCFLNKACVDRLTGFRMKEVRMSRSRPGETRGRWGLVLALAAWGGEGLAHPDKVERDLVTHFATGAHAPEGGVWQDLTHNASARLVGAPVWTDIGPAQAVALGGGGDYLVLADSPAGAEKILPREAFSVAAWVMINEPREDGGIIGLAQDNADFEKGWVLGYNGRHFTFTLSTKGTDDGNGRLTRLVGRSEIAVGRWSHVAATFDGKTMRLYVNGRLEGESAEQSGEILYPERGRYVLGAYADDNELNPMNGAVYEVKVFARELQAAEIGQAVERSRKLIEAPGAANPVLQFTVKPYLQHATASSLRILCETTLPSKMTVEYGERQPFSNRVTAAEAGAINEVRLEGLKPHTPCFYRVTCVDARGNSVRSEVCSFQTLPGPELPWAFGILGDTQRNPEVTRKCAEGIFALRPNFMLHCGDVVDDGFAKHQWVNDLFEPCGRVFAHVPVFPVIGNHERNSHWYYDYFSLPGPEWFYTFKVGNAEFFMVDSNKDCSPGSEQYQRLEKALEGSSAVWKFAAHHHPCFSSDENDYGDKWTGKPGKEPMGWGESGVRHLIPLYEKHGIDIAFAGHIHSYERTWPILNMAVNQKRGVRYIVSGGGGGGLEQAAPQRSWFSIHVQRGHHYCFATVHDRTIQFKAYDLEGRLFDGFELTKADNR